MIRYNTLIVLLGTGLLGANAGLIGSFAVLRQRALTGDALAHAALPGLCIAYWLTGQRSLPALLLGALISGLVGVACISALRSATRIKEDAAIGIVLSVFFGAGVVLVRLIAGNAGIDSYILGRAASMIRSDVLLIAAVSALSLATVLLLYKEFKLVIFDGGFARVQGWPSLWLDLLMMGLVALTVVIGLPAVGVVLVAALLIIPPAAARFWTDRLGQMLLIASLFGLAIGVVGTSISAVFSNIPTGPIIVLSGTTLFLISMLFAPRRGAVARWLAQLRLQREHAMRSLLRSLYDELEADWPERRSFSEVDLQHGRPGPLRQARRLLQRAARAGYVRGAAQGAYLITDDGMRAAAHAARNSRLWEQLLTDYPDWAASAIDLEAPSPDEILPESILDELSSKLAAQNRLPPSGEDVLRELA